MEGNIICRTKELFLGVTIFGTGEIRTKELEHAIAALIEGWAMLNGYETACQDLSVRDITKKLHAEVLADIAKEDQEEARRNSR